MKQVEERYISLLTDFGFKRIFGSAPNKDLLICFLNSLFNGLHVFAHAYAAPRRNLCRPPGRLCRNNIISYKKYIV